MSTSSAPGFEQARVRHVMRHWLITADPATPLVIAAQRMADERVHAVFIRDQAGEGGSASRPSAVLTDLDVLESASRAGDLTAGEAASGELLSVHPDQRLADVAARMLEHRVTHAVVVEPGTGQPVGVISTFDIARIVGWGWT